MKLMRYSVLMMFFQTMLYAHYSEFLYPVGTVIFEQVEKVCVLHQKGLVLELFLWDPVTKLAIKGLSHQTPAGFTVLPSREAFSFIDHEQVRIKALSKKSSKSLDLYPLHDFNLLHWIDNENFYCAAKEKKNYALFHIDSSGDFYTLLNDPFFDFTYPQKIGDQLFYLKKDVKKEIYAIEKTRYPAHEIKQIQERFLAQDNKNIFEELEEQNKICLIQASETLLTFNDKDFSLSFLTMKSEEEGFFLRHKTYPFADRVAQTIEFECCHFVYKNHAWKSASLFSFSLPLTFLYGQERLAESILRLVPQYQENNIVYVHTDKLGNLDAYRYDLEMQQSKCFTNDAYPHYFFRPFFYKDNGLLGGMIVSDDPEKSPTINIDMYGNHYITFPLIQ